MPMLIMGDALAVSFSELRETAQESKLKRQAFNNFTLQINNNNNFYINDLIENNYLRSKETSFHGVDFEVFTLEDFEVIGVESITIKRRNIVLVRGYPVNCDVEMSLGFLDLNLDIKNNHKLTITFFKKLDEQTADYKLLPLFVKNETTLMQNDCFPYAYANNEPDSPSNAHPEANETLKYITQKSKEISGALNKMRNLKVRVPRMILVSFLIVFGAFSLFGSKPWEFSVYGLFGLLALSIPLMLFIMNYEYRNSVYETPYGKITMNDFFNKYNKEFYNVLTKED